MKATKSDEDEDSPVQEQAVLQEGVDYYLEDELIVFTDSFLRRRGYCCKSGCRHCPYEEFENAKTNS